MALAVAALMVGLRKDYVEIEDGSGARTSVVTLKRNDYGLWQHVWDFGTPAAEILFQAQIDGEDIGRYGLIFRQPESEQVVASGPATTLIASQGRRNGVAADALSAWGVTDTTHLRERITYPVPTVDIPATTGSTGHTWSAFSRTKTGPAETVALDFARENIGASALARRKLANATVIVPASLGRGPTRTYTATANENVLTVMQECFAGTNLTFDLVQTADNELTLMVRESQLREGIVWSVEAGTAAGVAVKAQRRPKTSVINSGSGDDATTVYVRRDAPVPPGGFSEVREEFIKGSGDDPVELSGEADEELVEDSAEVGLDIEPMPDLPWRVGVDYFLGDEVYAQFRDTPFPAPLEQVIIRHEGGTLTEEPSAAFTDDDDLSPILTDLYRQLRRLRRRS